MVRSVLYLEPKNGDYDAVVELYRRDDVLGRASRQAGFIGSELQLPTSGTGPILVTALWQDEAAYGGWVSNPVRAAGSAALAGLVEGGLTEETRGETYSVVLSVGEPVPTTTGGPA